MRIVDTDYNKIQFPQVGQGYIICDDVWCTVAFGKVESYIDGVLIMNMRDEDEQLKLTRNGDEWEKVK